MKWELHELRDRFEQLRRGLDDSRLDDPTPEDMLDLMLGLDVLKARVKEVEVECKELARDWIKSTGEDLVFVEKPGEVSPGDFRYYLGKTSSVKQRHPTTAGTVALLEDALTAAGGDMEKLADEVLSTNWCKQGGFKTLAGEETWAAHFERVSDDAALKDGKPTVKQRKLIKDRPFFTKR